MDGPEPSLLPVFVLMMGGTVAVSAVGLLVSLVARWLSPPYRH